MNKTTSHNWMYVMLMSSVSNKVRIYVEETGVEITLWMATWEDCVLLIETDERNRTISPFTHSQMLAQLKQYGTSPHDRRWRKIER